MRSSSTSQGGAAEALPGAHRRSGEALAVPREDIDVRKRFDDYLGAYEKAITETSTEWAPWYVSRPRNWVKALAVAQLLVAALERMDPGCARLSRASRTSSSSSSARGCAD